MPDPATPPELPEHTIELMYPAEHIEARVAEIANEIDRDLGDRTPVIVCVLKGSFVFVADLIRRLSMPVEVEFMRVSSYGNQIVTSGEVRLELDLQNSIQNRDVLLVEDIVDTGLTLEYLNATLKNRDPASLRTCTLLHKPANNVKVSHLDYVGFSVPPDFVVGYGLDWQGHYRHLPYIAKVLM